MKQGPNVKKLIAHKMSLLLCPPGCGDGKDGAFGAALNNLAKPGNLAAMAKEATRYVEASLAAVKNCRDNPYKDDEEIAGAILKGIEERLAKP